MKSGLIRGASKRLLRQWSSRSTISVEQVKPVASDPKPIPRTRRGVKYSVRFVDQPETHEAEQPLSALDIASRWYSNDDIDAFKQELGVLVKELRTGDGRAPSPLAKSIQKAYLALTSASSMDEVFRIIRKSKVTIPDECVGVEKYILPPKPLQAKKREVLEEAVFWEDLVSSESIEKLRLACREHSRGLEYFAYFLAERAASLA